MYVEIRNGDEFTPKVLSVFMSGKLHVISSNI